MTGDAGRGALLAVPAFGGGRGGGHLSRSVALIRELRALGREAYIFIPGASSDSPTGEMPGLLGDMDAAWILASEEEIDSQSWEWIILDRFQTAPEEFKRWAALAPVIGIDEGGPARGSFDFLIDLLPGLPGMHPANITAPYLLPLPKKNDRETSPASRLSRQVEGGELPGGLSPVGGCPQWEPVPLESRRGSVPVGGGLSPLEGVCPHWRGPVPPESLSSAGGLSPLGACPSEGRLGSVPTDTPSPAWGLSPPGACPHDPRLGSVPTEPPPAAGGLSPPGACPSEGRRGSVPVGGGLSPLEGGCPRWRGAVPVEGPVPPDPQTSPETPERVLRRINILVSFGAEDTVGLTIPSALALLPRNRADNEAAITISALFGPLNKTPPRDRDGLKQAGVRVLEPLSSLGESLAAYNLVITHYGVTAFEALHAGTAVILVSPSRYHEQLARTAGFISAGTGPAAFRKLRTLIYGRRVKSEADDNSAGKINNRSLRSISLRCRELAARYLESGGGLSLSGLIDSFTPFLSPACPVCGRTDRLEDPVLARFPERTYRRCRRCSLVYMERAAPPSFEYDIDYFFDSYKEQYGKTYLQDFPGLKKAGEIRLRRIRQILRKSGGPHAAPERLLDIGCAFGPFLAAAMEADFEPSGIDPCEEAAAYVRDKLRIPARRGFFPEQTRGENGEDTGEACPKESFSVITLWYVIEHFRNPREALAEIHRLLKPGGVLAFSTPSFSGISARKSPVEFLRSSPADHWTVWDPRRLPRILGRIGFDVKKTVITGHHPERFPIIGPFLKDRRGLVYKFCHSVSRILGWGDTFEVYAVKRDSKGA